MLLVLALTIQQFYRSRSRLVETDQETQLLALLRQRVAGELEGAQNVTATNPDLVLLCADNNDPAYLPATYPNPAPDPEPVWDPATGLMTVRYYHDPSLVSLLREVRFADGRTSQQRVAEQIYGFTVSNTTDRDFRVQVTYQQKRGLHTLQQHVHRAD